MIEEELPDELENDLDDIEPVGDESQLYEHFRVVVDKGQAMVRVDKYLFERIVNASRNRIQKAAEGGFVMANGKPVKSSYKVKPLDVITVMMDRPRYENEIIPEDIPLTIVYEDPYLMVVNKPAGLVVHPGHGNYHGTLVNALAWHMKDNPDYDANDPLVISIAAGKTLGFIEEVLGFSPALVRVMPNINAKVGAAMSAFCANQQVTQEQKKLVARLFYAIGQVKELDEAFFPLFGVIAGSAPAFAYLFIDSLARAAVKNGMQKQVALEIAAQTVLGSAKLILEGREHPWTSSSLPSVPARAVWPRQRPRSWSSSASMTRRPTLS